MRQKLLDWAAVLSLGALVGLVFMGLLAGWVWWQHGEVTIQWLEMPGYALVGLCLVGGGSMLSAGKGNSPLRWNGPARSYAVHEQTAKSPPERRETMLQQMSFGVVLFAAGLWSMAYLFAYDALTR